MIVFSVPFHDLNCVYRCEPEGPSNLVVYINVQNDI